MRSVERDGRREAQADKPNWTAYAWCYRSFFRGNAALLVQLYTCTWAVLMTK